MTLSFPKDSKFSVPVPTNSSAIVLPPKDKSSVVYAVPHSEVNSFVNSVAELPIAEGHQDDAGRQWVQVRLDGVDRSWMERIRESTNAFWGLIEVFCDFVWIS